MRPKLINATAVCALALSAAAGAVAACSSDETTNPTAADAAADAAVVTPEDAAPDASVTDGGVLFAPDTGTPDAGACPPSQPLFASGFQPACVSCLGASCCAQVKACEGVADCKAFAQCFAGCMADGGTKSPCQTTCIVGKDGGAIQVPYNELVLCGGNACAACPY